MAYQISEQILQYNNPGTPLQPQGITIHSTDTQGATAQNEHDFFNGGNRQASAHYFTDWIQIIRNIKENCIAWHAGPSANKRYLSVEMCEPKGINPAQFQEVWNRTVWLVADACVRYGWNTNDNVFSHRGMSLMYKETDHTDPIGFLQRYGKTWDQLLQAIDAKIIELKQPQPVVQGGNTVKSNYLVLYYSYGDLNMAAELAKSLACPLIFYTQATPDMKDSVTTIYQVGGSNSSPSVKVLSGTDAPATMIATLKAMGRL